MRKRMGKWFALLLGATSLSGGPAMAETRQFSVDEGTNFAAALSPDGSEIVIDVQGDIRILPAAGGAARTLIELPDEARLPAWSPDGQWITFQHFSAGQWRVFVIAPDGRGLRQLTHGTADDREPVWSADGQSILFSSDRAGNFDIWKVGLNGGEPEQITDSPADEYFPASSRGGMLAFVAANKAGKDIVVREQGKDRILASSRNELTSPAWNDAGDQLAYVEYRGQSKGQHPGMSAVNMVDLSTGSVTPQTPAGEDVFMTRPQWMRDGALFYTADGKIRTRGDMLTRDIPFTAQFEVQRPAPYRHKRQDFFSTAKQPVKGLLGVTVSPDGKKIAFSAIGDLWVLTIGEPIAERITNDPWVDIDPAWSPDGSKLAYVSDRRGTGTMDIYLRDMKTGREERITETAESLAAPAFSPDGKQLAVMMLDHDDWHSHRLHLFDLPTRQLRKLDTMQFKPSGPTWLPDGKTIAYVSVAPLSHRFRKGRNAVRLVPVDGSPPRFASPTPDVSLGVRAKDGVVWSPDGRRAAFIQGGTLWTISTAPDGSFEGAPQRLTNDLADRPSWTADSKTIVFTSAERLKHIRVDDGAVEDIPLTLEWTPAQPGDRKIIRAGRLFDGRSLTYRKDVDILVEGNVIREIVPRGKHWENAEIIDASQQTVIPGLFENHIHNMIINGEITGRIALAFGITSVREPGTEPSEGREAKEAWASGRRIGPRLFTTGLIEGDRVYYPMSAPVRSSAALELELERARRFDVDFIKTYEQLDAPYLKRAIEFAHDLGIPATSHDAYPAARFGADAVEHLTTRDRSFASDRLSFQGKIYKDAEQIYAQSGMAVVPTAFGFEMTMGGYYLEQAGRSLRELPQLGLFPERFRNSDAIAGAAPRGKPAFSPDLMKSSTSAIRTLVAAGVPIPPGTDTLFYNLGFGVIGELAYYTEAGLSPAQAIQQATLESAKLNHVEDTLGSIEPGKLADMVIISGDPLASITDLVNVSAVVKNGEVYPLERLLAGPR